MKNFSTTDGLASFSLLPAGDLGLRPAGAGHEVHRPAHAGAPDVPDAPEHDAALRQAQPPHQHVPVRPEKRQGPAVGGESSVVFKHEAGVESGGPGGSKGGVVLFKLGVVPWGCGRSSCTVSESQCHSDHDTF